MIMRNATNHTENELVNRRPTLPRHTCRNSSDRGRPVKRPLAPTAVQVSDSD